MLYADTSAVAKLVLNEPESAALQEYLKTRPGLASSALIATELMRSVRRSRPDLEEEASLLLARIALIDVDRVILRMAGRLEPVSLRSLDVIHLATAISLGGSLDALITYDARMSEAAREAGIPVEAPV